jgi:hypothetical protein
MFISPAARRRLSAKTAWVHSPSARRWRGFTAFLHDLLQDVAIEREVGDETLEFAILLAQLPQLAQLAQAYAGVFFLQM